MYTGGVCTLVECGVWTLMEYVSRESDRFALFSVAVYTRLVVISDYPNFKKVFYLFDGSQTVRILTLHESPT